MIWPDMKQRYCSHPKILVCYNNTSQYALLLDLTYSNFPTMAIFLFIFRLSLCAVSGIQVPAKDCLLL